MIALRSNRAADRAARSVLFATTFAVEDKTGFDHKIYEDAPGGHVFNRLDTKLAKESRREIWRFFADQLRPERPMR